MARGAQGMNLVAAASLGKLDLVFAFLGSGTPLASLPRRPVPAEPNDHWAADSACMKGVISDALYAACRNGRITAFWQQGVGFSQLTCGHTANHKRRSRVLRV